MVFKKRAIIGKRWGNRAILLISVFNSISVEVALHLNQCSPVDAVPPWIDHHEYFRKEHVDLVKVAEEGQLLFRLRKRRESGYVANAHNTCGQK